MTEKVSNGSFEGTLDDWDVVAYGVSGTGASPTLTDAYCGSYSCVLEAKYDGSNGYVEISQEVDTRCATYLTFYINYPSGYYHSANTTLKVYIGSTYQNLYPSTSWGSQIQVTIPAGEKAANTLIKFRLATTYTTDFERVRIDCVSVDASESAPTAGYSANDTTPTTAETVTFTNSSSAGCPAPMTYLWTFSPATVTYMDSTNNTSANPHVRFDAADTYTVTLRATNSYGYDEEVKVDYITATPPPTAPTADFTVAATGCKPGETIPFTNTTDEGYPAVSAWEWKVNGETTPSGTDWEWSSGSSTSEEPTVRLNDVGSYTVSLKATNPTGNDTETKTDYLACIANPTGAYVKNNWCALIGGYLEK